MTTSEFDNYIIYHEQTPDSNEKATITCYKGSRTVGYMHFHDGDLPAPEVLPTGVMNLTFEFGRLKEIIDTIRYEKPLFISLYGNKSVLSTVREPVGEQEGH